MIVSLFMFGWTADEHTQIKKIKNYRCKKTVSQIIKNREGWGARTHTRTHTPLSCGQRPFTDRHSMLSQIESAQWIRLNIPIEKKKITNKTHTTAFYPIGSVMTKSPHSGPHSCCYGAKAGLGGKEGFRRKGRGQER